MRKSLVNRASTIISNVRYTYYVLLGYREHLRKLIFQA